MELERINHKNIDGGTPLDDCYEWNKSSIKCIGAVVTLALPNGIPFKFIVPVEINAQQTILLR